MAEKPQHEIAKDLKELYERGKQAYERNNLEYAIQLQELVLKPRSVKIYSKMLA